jgi:hypothetical protein
VLEARERVARHPYVRLEPQRAAATLEECLEAEAVEELAHHEGLFRLDEADFEELFDVRVVEAGRPPQAVERDLLQLGVLDEAGA